MGNVANPGNVVGQFPRLQYALMQYALKLKSAPTGAEMQAACREAWEQFQSTRGVEESVTFDDFRHAFEAILTRDTVLLSRPAA